MNFHNLRTRIKIIAVLLITAISFPSNAATSLEIQGAIAERLRDENYVAQSIVGRILRQSDILLRIYASTQYAPLWSNPQQILRFLQLISDADEDGLLVDDYHLSELREMMPTANSSAVAQAEFDIVLTDSFARLAYHLRFGKANPHDLDPNWNFSRALITSDPAAWLRGAIERDEIPSALEWLRPKIPPYQSLKAALQHYRKLSTLGNWPIIPEGPTLKAGMDDPRVALVHARLASKLGQPVNVHENNYFDQDLEHLVRKFQVRYGLFEDGFVGDRTRSAMNMSIADHIAQLRVNMERVRWLFRDIDDNYITVNIAAFQAAYINHGEVLWRARAVVGRAFRQTPIFKSTMTYMVFNPTWTIPPTILKQDALPAISKDLGYLTRKHLRVLTPAGVELDPLTIDWKRANNGHFPYQLRQDPGPHNALGRVKFIFPNPHFVYLHDTPSRELFGRAERTFSSGCIRIERSLELAQILLDANSDPRKAQVREFLDTQSPRKVKLKVPITVMLLYLTAFSEGDGTVHFRRDIYQRDKKVLDAIDGPFNFVPPGGYIKSQLNSL